jgi:hypothetical protein
MMETMRETPSLSEIVGAVSWGRWLFDGLKRMETLGGHVDGDGPGVDVHLISWPLQDGRGLLEAANGRGGEATTWAGRGRSKGRRPSGWRPCLVAAEEEDGRAEEMTAGRCL